MPNSSGRRAIAALVAVLALALASSGTLAQSPPLVSLKIATSPQAATAEAYFADELGFFRKHGLDAQITTVSRGTGSAVAAVVLGHAADIGEADIIALCSAHEHGIPLTIVAPSAAYSQNSPAIHELIVDKNSPIRTAKDLNGKTVSVVSLEGPAKLAAAKWLDEQGADLSTIQFIELPAAAAGPALEKGTVAAAMVPEPYLTAALSKTRVLADTYRFAYGRPFQLSYWFSTPDWAQANPDAVKRFAAAMHEAAIWTNDPANVAQYNTILAKITKLPPETIAAMNRANYGVTVDIAQSQKIIDAGVKYKSLHDVCPAKDLVNANAIVK